MPKGLKGQKRPADVVANAAKVMQIATGEAEEEFDDNSKDKSAQSLGRRGGKARAEKVPPARISDIARQAAQMRWKDDKK